MQLRVVADQTTRPDDAGSCTPLQRRCTFIRMLRLSNYTYTSMVLEETSHLRTVFFSRLRTALSPFDIHFKGESRSATLSRCRPPGRLVQSWMISQLEVSWSRRWSRLERGWDDREKHRRQAQAPFHGVGSVCEGDRRHHLMPAGPVRF